MLYFTGSAWWSVWLACLQVPPPKVRPASSSVYKDPSLSLAEQYKMRQGIKLQVPALFLYTYVVAKLQRGM
jgi:hypothetical protein